MRVKRVKFENCKRTHYISTRIFPTEFSKTGDSCDYWKCQFKNLPINNVFEITERLLTIYQNAILIYFKYETSVPFIKRIK